jgi:2-desacetyl-2-hydroxyethyl bacteriochlorophyllide A dehydrogenase
MKSHSVWFSSPEQVEIREVELSEPQAGQALVESRLSAISPGTEMLFYRGQVPEELNADAVIPSLQGQTAFPIKYGYANVGEVVQIGPGVSPKWLRRKVFSFHPHESAYLSTPADLFPIPEGIAWEDAVFLPNMETAVNLVMDAAPLVGEIAAVFGLGIVGLLVLSILSQMPLSLRIAIDPIGSRRNAARDAGAGVALDPADPEFIARALDAAEQTGSPGGVDLALECSGSPQALDQAIQLTGYHGRVVIGSWYGKKTVALNLGGKFHRSRIQLISSQVSSVAPGLSGRWSKARRFRTAWEMIARLHPARWITHRFPVLQAEDAYRLVDQHPAETIQVVFEY